MKLYLTRLEPIKSTKKFAKIDVAIETMKKGTAEASTVGTLPPPQALLIESSNRCGRKFRDAQAVLILAGKARKRLLNNTSISRQKCRFLVTTK